MKTKEFLVKIRINEADDEKMAIDAARFVLMDVPGVVSVTELDKGTE